MENAENEGSQPKSLTNPALVSCWKVPSALPLLSCHMSFLFTS